MIKLLVLNVIALFALLPVNGVFSTTELIPPPPIDRDLHKVEEKVEQAIIDALKFHRENILTILLHDTKIDRITISTDQDWAIAYIVPVNPDTKLILSSEPALVLVNKQNNNWNVFLPSDPAWPALLKEIPTSLLNPIEKATWLEMYRENVDSTVSTTYSGYLLPWRAGEGIVLTQSISHYSPPNPNGSMHYSFDFSTWHDSSGTSPMFAIYASKSGYVKYVYITQPNGSEDPPGNYIVLEDITTSPPTYQLYLHLAKDTIPAEIRTVGTFIKQGQFIGMADDTGYSSGNHLHFQVHTNPYSYWGSSVDITFDDVSINGGRPRTPNEAKYYPQYGTQGQWEYISGNIPQGDNQAPIGDITSPNMGSSINQSTLPLSGWVFDNSGTTLARFKASYGNSWRAISDWFTSPEFDYSWDLCSDQVPDGPITLALDIQDGEGNWASSLPGLRHVIKNFTCTQPAAECIPNDDQVALFSDSDYGGSCTLFAIGDHADLDPIGDNQASSVLIGSNVFATLFLQNDFSGRGETFFANDSYFKDNKIGDNTVSSIKVRQNTNLPTTPIPIWPDNGEAYPNGTSLSLAWEDSSGASEYLLEIQGISQTWQSDFFTNLGSLSPGTYPWRVKSRNANGESDFSPIQTLIIEDNPLSPVISHTAPWSDDMEASTSDWDKGDNWDIANDNDIDHPGEFIYRYEIDDISGTYDNDLPNTGDLTSPEIMIPDDGNTYYLRFGYLYETEGPGFQWDQRWVQISVDGNPFKNLFQLLDDPTNYWLERPVISLNDYAGATIRVRFHFETLDDVSNDFKGWYIDDFSITDIPPPSCQQSGEPNNTLEQAHEIDVNNPVNGNICPGGDIDYYYFSGSAGDRIGLTTIAQRNGSDLDTYIYLLDSNGSVLAENDDIILYKNIDSTLSFILPSTDTYYVKIRAWNHPAAGSDNHFYTLYLANDSSDPIAEFSSPSDYSYLPKGGMDLIIDANDTDSGISHVDFYWHSSDWEFGSWEYIESDWENDDGWSVKFDTTQLPEQHNIAFYAKVYDWSGNSVDVGTWNLRLYQHVNIIYLPTIRFTH